MKQKDNVSLMFVFLSYQKKFSGIQKQVRISHDNWDIGGRVVEVPLY